MVLISLGLLLYVTRSSLRRRTSWSQWGSILLYSIVSLLVLIKLHYGQTEEKLEAYLTLEPHLSHVYPGDEVTLRCGIKESIANEWEFGWRKDREDLKNIGEEYRIGSVGPSDMGKYKCFGRSKWNGGDSKWSDGVEVTVTALPTAGLTISPNPAYSGETVTLTCTVESGFGWSYRWFRDNREITEYQSAVITISTDVSVQGRYSCQGSKESRPTSSSPSETTDLSVDVNKPVAFIGSDKTAVFTRDKVTFTCSVGESSGWKFYCYRNSTGSDPVSVSSEGLYTFTPSSVSDGGEFLCRGGRGDPVYYTEYSQPISISVTARPYAVITMQPNWTHTYVGETVTLHCDVKGTEDVTDWKYIWYRNGANMEHNSPKDSEYRVHTTTPVEPSVEFTCKGVRDSVRSDTSEPLRVTVSGNPQSALRVSPSWLHPGDSVTLTCEVEVSSTDWRFYWYRTVPYKAELPSLADQSCSVEPLLDSDHGTGESSYILHGATHTAGYVCRAGRGQPVYYSDYSKPQFLWSGGQHPSVSLTVNTNRIQHFTSETVSLSCEGNSSGWKVKRNTAYGVSDCSSYWGSMTGSTCSLKMLYTWYSGVYWCESGSGECSNAVNITVTSGNVILESPVHPVTEGDSVTLHCKHKNPSSNSKADFYKDGGLIQNGTSGEMTIPAVSKSHEGLYRCRSSDENESPESWLVVRASGSRTPLSDLFMGLVVFGILLVLFLFLIPLFCYQKGKGACFGTKSGFMPSQGTNQSPGLHLGANQNPPLSDDGYSPPHNGGTNVYEAIKATETNEHAGPNDVTYSELELKNFSMQEKAKRAALVEETVYSDLKTAASPESSTPVQADCVYAEVKKGSTLARLNQNI